MAVAYAKIYRTIFNDEKIRNLSPLAQLLFIRLLCHPHITRLGTLTMGIGAISEEFGWDIETVTQTVTETVSKGLLKRSISPPVLWFPNYLKHNKPDNPNMIISWSQALDLIPECQLRSEIVENTRSRIESMPESFQKALPDVFYETVTYTVCETVTQTVPLTVCQTSNRNSNRNSNRSRREITPLPLLSDTPEKKQKSAELNRIIHSVFEHWQKTMNHPKAKLDDTRKRIIKKALDMGYSETDLCQAITGCSLTPHNMGDNDRGEIYDGLHVILKNADQIDRFMANAEKPPASNGYKPDSVTRHNQAVLQELLSNVYAENNQPQPPSAPTQPQQLTFMDEDNLYNEYP